MYRAPIKDMTHTLRNIAELDVTLEQNRFGDLSSDLVGAILEEAAKFASERIAPFGEENDHHNVLLNNGFVTTTPGTKELYRDWIAGGWNALTGTKVFGGQALPMMLAVAVNEMWNAGSMAFALAPTLTMSAVETLEKHASDALKETYLPKLISGEWTGTMNLTEPQAGSDLSALRTYAKPNNDGTYRIFGQKIFITYGEHDLTENIIHLVLARLPDAPPGTKGISLFLVPKFLVNADRSLGWRNDVFCSSLEHKLGIHASPTCTMIYGDGFSKENGNPGAIGWLVGEENRGLACMFTMMNKARLLVGIQGVAIAEAAFQKARTYAQGRQQGHASNAPINTMSPIIDHPDIQRMLLTMKSLTHAARAICYICAHALDMARTGTGEEANYWIDRANLLTPIAKAFATDIGVDAASFSIQIHGGMGFIEETGVARLLRDVRITPIYEGTNGIQAIDLVQRKLLLNNGKAVKDYIGELRTIVDNIASTQVKFNEMVSRLTSALDDLEETTLFLQHALAKGQQKQALCGATPYLRLFGLAAGGAYLAKGALKEKEETHLMLCCFYTENLLSETQTLKDRVIGGSQSLLAAAHLVLQEA